MSKLTRCFRACQTAAMLCAAILFTGLPVLAQDGGAHKASEAKAADAIAPEDQLIIDAGKARQWERALALLDARLTDASVGDIGRLTGARAKVLFELERFDESEAAFRGAISLMPKNAALWSGLCWLQILQGRSLAAREACARSFAEAPNFPRAVNLGHTYLLNEDDAAAYRWYEEAIAFSYSEEEMRDGLIADLNLFVQRGWRPDAVRQVRETVLRWHAAKQAIVERFKDVPAEVSPQNRDRVLSAGRELLQQVESTLGKDTLSMSNAAQHIATLYYVSGLCREALPLYLRALQISQKVRGERDRLSVGILNNTAACYQDLGRHKEALPMLQNALAMSEALDGPRSADLISTLTNLGNSYQAMANWQEAGRVFDRALEISIDLFGANSEKTVRALVNLADLRRELDQSSEARGFYERALAIVTKTEQADPSTLAEIQNGLALIENDQGNYAASLQLLQQALVRREKVLGPAHPHTVKVLINLASVVANMGRHEEALDYFKRARSIQEKGPDADDSRSVGLTLSGLGMLYHDMGRYVEAQPLMERAVEVSARANGPDHPITAHMLYNLAQLHDTLGNYALAWPLMRRALAINEKTEGADGRGTYIRLEYLARLYQSMGRYPEALEAGERALALRRRRSGDSHPGTATSLNNVADLYKAMGRYEQARALYLQALEINERVEGADHPHTARGLSNLASLYLDMGNPSAALPLAQRALTIAEKLYDEGHPVIAAVLSVVASAHKDLGRYDQVAPLLRRALDISEKRSGSHHPDTASALGNLGLFLLDNGQIEQALAMLERALEINRTALGSLHPSTAVAMNNLAGSYRLKRERAQEKKLLEQALEASSHSAGPGHPSTARALENLAGWYHQAGQYQQARKLAERGLAIREKTLGSHHPDTLLSLSNLAGTYSSLGMPQKALSHALRALQIASEHEDQPLHAAAVRGELANIYARQGELNLAVRYGKQSVNGFQALRGRLAKVDRELQQGFLKRWQHYYQLLAAVLIDTGRFAEAQQVTAMLKEQELFEQLRRNGVAPDGDAAESTYTEFEEGSTRQEAALAQTLSATARELDKLRAEAARGTGGADLQRRQAELESTLEQGREQFSQFLRDLRVSYRQMSEQQRQQVEELNLRQIAPMQKTLAKLGHGVVLLHYVALDDGLKIMLTTPQVQRGLSVAVGEAELNRAVFALRDAILQRGDVRGPARQLHDWLITPIQKELDAAGAQTLMVASTGALRYAPLAALHNGEQWLVQRYALAMYTEAARDGLAERRSDADWPWRVDAFGLTRPVAGFDALPSVRDELNGIVGGNGLAGKVRLDQDFTERSLVDALAGQPQVLHVASHFQLRPGSETGSFLLLGDGQRLSLARIQQLRFTGVELVTLSACETAMGGGQRADGEEIEGFGALARLGGAYAVLASLWPVADNSTARLMQQFYLKRERTPGLPKALALQKAQLALIEGSDLGAAEESNSAARSAQREDVELRGAERPGPARHYSHPYYWAPFILMGNWL